MHYHQTKYTTKSFLRSFILCFTRNVRDLIAYLVALYILRRVNTTNATCFHFFLNQKKRSVKMADYKPGALSELIGNGKQDAVDDLFKGETFVPASTEETSKKAEADSDTDDEKEEYKQPSRKFKVLKEENNRVKPRDVEQEKRTVFLGNLPCKISAKQIKQCFKKFGEIETIRLRGASRPDMKTTKKQAIIQRKFHEKSNSIIAYVRFKNEEAAHESLTMNGQTAFDERTLRVDLSVPKDDSSNKHDQSKAIFVGNLGFSIDEEDVQNHFAKCGKITNVRIVRDSKTGIGKGFCYVNFVKASSVKLALDLMSGTTLGGRELRVSKSVERPKKTVALIPKISMAKSTFPSKKVAKVKPKITKVPKRQLKRSFEGKKFDDDKKTKGDKKKKKKKSQGERQRKSIAKQLVKKS